MKLTLKRRFATNSLCCEKLVIEIKTIWSVEISVEA